jgi:hypothetical protein
MYFRRTTNNNNEELCNTFLYLLLNGPHTLGYYDVQLLPSWTKPFQFLIHELPALCWNSLGITRIGLRDRVDLRRFSSTIFIRSFSHPRTLEIEC